MTWTYHRDLLSRPVPRYTSYPTAAEFTEAVGADAQAQGLAMVGTDERVSLYLHIPYCQKICWYCGCNTGAANKVQRLKRYLDALHAEIDQVAGRLNGRGRVTRIAFGGGSPNAIPADEMRALADHLRRAFSIGADADLSIEIDPRGFDAAFADAIRDIGFARASLGVQTFDPALQARIGRVQDDACIRQSVSMLRKAGVTSLNMDLMYGLPGQDVFILEDSIDKALALGADRLAVFGYAHVPHLLPRQRRIDASRLPDARSRFRMAEIAHERLSARGFTPIGFDHFARPDDPMGMAAREGRIRRDFQGFTDDGADVMIGLGASAISRFAHATVQNEHHAGRYALRVGNGLMPASRGITTPPTEQRIGAAIERLLCAGEADLSGFANLARIRQYLAPFEQRGLLRWHGTRLLLPEEARPYARSIAATLDPWRRDDQRRFSSAV